MTQRERFVQAALGELGTKGGSKYVAWYNGVCGTTFALNVAWCAIFVSWCARQAGLTAAQVPSFSGCTTGRRLLQSRGVWYGRDARVPERGDLVLFDWDGDPTLAEHVGIVTGVDRVYVYTVEGNSGNAVKTCRYPRTSKNILGYGAWVEEEVVEDMTREETKRLIDEAVAALPRPVVYHTLDEVPQWGRETAEALAREGLLRGVGNGDLALSEEMLRVLVIVARKEGAA